MIKFRIFFLIRTLNLFEIGLRFSAGIGDQGVACARAPAHLRAHALALSLPHALALVRLRALNALNALASSRPRARARRPHAPSFTLTPAYPSFDSPLPPGGYALASTPSSPSAIMDARSGDLTHRPRYERRERDGHRCYAYTEARRERNSRSEYTNIESRWREGFEQAQGRRHDDDSVHLSRRSESRGEVMRFPAPEWRRMDGHSVRTAAHADFDAEPGASRGAGPSQMNLQLNKRLIAARGAHELLSLHAEHGRNFNIVNLATCWSRLGRVGCREGFAWQLEALREQTLSTLGGWGARELSNLTHALGKLAAICCTWSSLWEAVARASLRRCREFDSQHLSNTAWAFAKACRPVPALMCAIAAEATKRVHKFNPQELANTAWAYATAGHAAPALLVAIAVEAVPRVREFSPQDFSNTVWAYVTSGHAAPALLGAIAVEAATRVRKFTAQDFAITAWAYATAGHAAPALLDAIAAEAASRLRESRAREFSSQNLTNMAWAYATAGHAAPALLDAIAAEAAPRVHEFSPQSLTNTAWAYATAGHAAPALLDAIAVEAAPRVREFTPQDFAITAWAYATAGHAAPALLDAIAAEAASRLRESRAREFSSQNLTNTAWAYATAGHAAPALLDAIAAQAAPRVHEFSPQSLANTAWAYATAGHAAPALLVAIAAEAAPRVREFNPQDFANTVWAYATAGHRAPTLLDAIAAEAAPRVREFSDQNLTNAAWAYATAGHAAPALLDAIAAEAAPRVREFTAHAITNMAWAYAVANHPTDGSGLFGERFIRRCEELARELAIKNLRQLHQWALWHAGERGRSDCLLSDDLLERCRAAFAIADAHPSSLQRQVGTALEALGLSPTEEVSLDDGYSIDLVVEWRGDRVGVEVDGPFHFLGREPNSATLLKRRQLRHLGWRLVSVPYWEWDEVVGSSQRATKYLASLLDGLAAFSVTAGA